MSKNIIFNGPVEFDMQVFVINDETGQEAKVTIGIGTFEYPTPQKIKERLEKMTATEFIGSLNGFRLMNKKEAWRTVMLDKTGQEFAMVGSKEWNEICCIECRKTKGVSDET